MVKIMGAINHSRNQRVKRHIAYRQVQRPPLPSLIYWVGSGDSGLKPDGIVYTFVVGLQIPEELSDSSKVSSAITIPSRMIRFRNVLLDQTTKLSSWHVADPLLEGS